MRFRLPGGKQQDLFAQIDHAKKLAARPGPLDKLAAAIDFEIFRPQLMMLLGFEGRRDKGGNAPFDPVFMFKVIVLQNTTASAKSRSKYRFPTVSVSCVSWAPSPATNCPTKTPSGISRSC